MHIRRSWLALAVLLIPAAVRADDHRADRFAAFSGAGGSSLFGVHVTDAITLPLANTHKDLALLGDLSVHFGSRNEKHVTRVTALVGPRWTFAKEVEARNERPRLLPFVHALVGVVYNNDGGANDTDPAVGFGAGVDYVRRNAAREAWATRLQVDYIKGGEGFLRVSAGLVYRFE